MGNTIYDPQYEQEFFPQSQDIPRLLEEDRDNLGIPAIQEKMLQALKRWQDIKDYLFNPYMTSLDKGVLSISWCSR